MRTNIVINDDLISDALSFSGVKTKKEVVELGLKMLVNLTKQEKIKAFKGKLKWQGDLEAMRTN